MNTRLGFIQLSIHSP